MDVLGDFKVDDSKVHILRGPASLRQIAIDIVTVHLNSIMAGKTDPITQDEHDAAQVINWLKQMET